MRKAGLDRRTVLSLSAATFAWPKIRGSLAQSSRKLDLSLFELTFEDDFLDLNLNPDPATDSIAPTGWVPEAGNGPNPDIELQRFVDPRNPATRAYSPFSIRDSILTIEVRLTPPNVEPTLVHQRKILSGLLMTKGWFRQQYGYFEARMKMPKGYSGNWPCFWLLPDNGMWPPEIDILEQVGADTKTAYLTIHLPPQGEVAKSQKGTKIAGPDLSDDFHVFGIDWQPGRVLYYRDRELVWEVMTTDDFDLPMYLILNLSIGGAGSWTGESSLAPTEFPRSFEIDYVRAYRRKLTPVAASRSPEGDAVISALSTRGFRLAPLQAEKIGGLVTSLAHVEPLSRGGRLIDAFDRLFLSLQTKEKLLVFDLCHPEQDVQAQWENASVSLPSGLTGPQRTGASDLHLGLRVRGEGSGGAAQFDDHNLLRLLPDTVDYRLAGERFQQGLACRPISSGHIIVTRGPTNSVVLFHNGEIWHTGAVYGPPAPRVSSSSLTLEGIPRDQFQAVHFGRKLNPDEVRIFDQFLSTYFS